ncbi:chemokine XC receptor 1-like [Hoplias malabaricus]|uniref:chemokine XC receptor 1-like n=1 Tax=Hoplias malabaricus TaxID=27720 RepID=UPI003462F160
MASLTQLKREKPVCRCKDPLRSNAMTSQPSISDAPCWMKNCIKTRFSTNLFFLCFPKHSTDAENKRVPMHDTYDEDETDEICHKETVARVGSIAIPIFFTIVVFLSLTGNIMVLVILVLYESLQSLTNIFILNLAVSDLMFTLGLPFWASYYIWGWIFGDAMCKGVNFVFFIGFYSSILFLMLMTIQRYVAVVYPLSDWEKGQKFTFVPIFAWVVSAAAAIPALVQSSFMSDPDDPNSLRCEPNSESGILVLTYLQNFFFVSAFVVMGFCYIRILQTVFRIQAQRRHRTIKLIFCIVVVFFVSWAPYNTVIFLQSLSHHGIEAFLECNVSKNLDYALYVFKFLAFSHCCLNPVFYAFVGVKFRNHLKMFLQVSQRQHDTDHDQQRITAV